MRMFKLYGLFVGLMVTVILACDAVVFKEVSIFGRHIVASGMIFPLSFMIACIATEVYGYKVAGTLIWIQVVCEFIFVAIISIVIRLPPHVSPETSVLYYSLYHNIWHILLAGTLAAPSSYFANDFIISKVKIYMYGRFFIFRYFLSCLISKGVLVLITYPILFYGVYGIEKIFDLMLNTWVFKVCIALFLMPFAVLLSNYVKKIEKVDSYDYGISYNPIKVFNINNSEEVKNKYEK
jgi:queuosine precursor transporter